MSINEGNVQKEKRRFIRHLLVNPLEFQIFEDENFRKSETIDVSEGGLMFTSRKGVAADAIINLQVPLYEKIFKIKAKVIHSQKDYSTGLYRIGVAFVNYSDAFKIKIIEQIYLIEEYRVLRSLQTGKDLSLPEASREWIKRYSARFKKLYW